MDKKNIKIYLNNQKNKKIRYFKYPEDTSYRNSIRKYLILKRVSTKFVLFAAMMIF